MHRMGVVEWTFSGYQLDEQQWLPMFWPAALAFFRVKSKKLACVVSIYKHARNHGLGLGCGPLYLVSWGWSASSLVLLVQCSGYGVPQLTLDVEGFFQLEFFGLLARSITLVSCHFMGRWYSQACSATVDFSSIPLQQASCCFFILVSSFLVVSPM